MLLLLMFLNYNLFMLKDLPLPNLDLGQNVRIFPEWTRTREGYRIGLYHSKDVTIAAKSKSTQPIIIIGGVHGDEPEGVEMATRCLNWASREADLCPWIIIPCINPEGYARPPQGTGRPRVSGPRGRPCERSGRGGNLHRRQG